MSKSVALLYDALDNVSGSIIPTPTDTHDLGSAANRWRALHAQRGYFNLDNETAAGVHIRSLATVSTPTAFTSDDFVLGRSPTSGATSGALFMRYNTSANSALIGALAPGSTWRPLNIIASGTIFADQNNVAKFAVRGSTGSGVFIHSSASAGVDLAASGDGNLLLTNAAGTDFGLLQLGGTTSSFGAIKKFDTAGNLEIRAADDSGPRDLFVRNVRAGPSSSALKIDFYAGAEPYQLRFANATTMGFSPNANAGAGGVDTTLARDGVSILHVGGATPLTTGAAIALTERTAPAAPAANGVRIYAEDNGAGKTRLMALFQSGAAVQIAIEP